MNQYSTSNMRLPSYRESYLRRFHPYPRVKLSQREMLMTIDDHFSNQRETLTYGVAVEEDTATPCPQLLVDPQHLVAVDLQEVIEGTDVDARPPVRRPSLRIIIVDLAALVARKLGF